MSKFLPPAGKVFALLFLFYPASQPLLADTIVLKSGERLEAKIGKTTDTTVEAEVKLSAGITDVRVIAKTDIATIERPDPSEEAFAALKAASPGPNSLTAAQYDANIHGQVNAFLGKYPASPHAGQVREMMAALTAEKKRVAAGEVKIENTWYTPVELEKQKGQVNATLLLQQMRALAQAGDNLGAMNVFTKLEKSFPGATAYPAAVDYALQVIPNLQKEVATKTAVYNNDMLERKKGMEIVPDFRKPALVAAAADEEAKANAALEAALKAGTKWTPIYPRHQKSLAELQKTITAENSRLAAIKTAPMFASISAVEEAKKQMSSGDLTAATASLQRASTLWAANASLKDAMADLARAKITPTPTPTPPPPLNKTPTPRSTKA